MIVLLIIVLALWLMAGAQFWRATRGANDDFGEGVLAFALLAAAVILTIIYLALALWLRSFV